MEDGIVEFKFKRLESDVHTLNRRVSDHDALHSEARKDIDMHSKILQSLERRIEQGEVANQLMSEVASYAKKTYEVFEPLAKFLSFAAKIAMIATFVWHAVKYGALKLFAVNL